MKENNYNFKPILTKITITLDKKEQDYYDKHHRLYRSEYRNCTTLNDNPYRLFIL